VTRTCCRILCVGALAAAVELCRVAPCAPWLPGRATAAFGQANAYPPGYYDPASAGGFGNASQMPATPVPSAFGSQNYGPSSPTPPANPARPASWPGGPQDQSTQATATSGAAPGAQVPAGAGPPPAAPDWSAKDPLEPPIEPAAILARVGSEVVQASEILPTARQTLDAFIAKLGDEFTKMPPEFQEERRKQWERELVERTLEDAIKIKLLMVEIRGTAQEEAITKNIERIRKEFNEHEIKRLMSVYKATSVVDLENKLRAQGGSLESQRMVYVERYMAISWLRQQVRQQKEPSHEQMANYYRQHLADWQRPARARWEQLTARFDKFPSKEAALQALRQWGNAVWFGAPLAEVAKQHSQGISAEEGGLNDWTTEGSLRSAAIDQALFGLPVGQLSQILEDEEGYHIVRVVEREERRTIPFNEVQPEIKQKLVDGDQQQLMTEYLAKLRERMPVHSVLDGGAAALAARPSEPLR
jgi:hypothetical protein